MARFEITLADGTKRIVDRDKAPTVGSKLSKQAPAEESRGAGGIGSFLKEQFTGRTGDRGILGDIVESTVGSRGLLGAFQLPGVVAGQLPALGSQRKLAESQQALAQSNTELQQRIRTETDPRRRTALQKALQTNLETLGQGREAQADLSQFIRTPRQAIGTAINAAATVGAGAAPRAATATGRVLTQAGLGGALGTGEALSRDASNSEALRQGAISTLIGGGISGAAGVAGAVSRRVTPSLGNFASEFFGATTSARAENIVRSFKEFAQVSPLRKAAVEGKNIIFEAANKLGKEFNSFAKKVNKDYGKQLQQIIDNNPDFKFDANSMIDEISSIVENSIGNVTKSSNKNRLKTVVKRLEELRKEQQGVPSTVLGEPSQEISLGIDQFNTLKKNIFDILDEGAVPPGTRKVLFDKTSAQIKQQFHGLIDASGLDDLVKLNSTHRIVMEGIVNRLNKQLTPEKREAFVASLFSGKNKTFWRDTLRNFDAESGSNFTDEIQNVMAANVTKDLFAAGLLRQSLTGILGAGLIGGVVSGVPAAGAAAAGTFAATSPRFVGAAATGLGRAAQQAGRAVPAIQAAGRAVPFISQALSGRQQQ